MLAPRTSRPVIAPRALFITVPPAPRKGAKSLAVGAGPSHLWKVIGGRAMNIGTAARQSGVPAKTIRYYQSVGLIGAAERTASGSRVHGREDVGPMRCVHGARRPPLQVGADGHRQHSGA